MFVELSEKIELTDSERRTTRDGYVATSARVARTGIQTYRGRELGLMDRETVAVWRPGDEVMDKASMASFAHKPITDNHPPELVDAKNWQKYAKGITGEQVARDGEFIVVPLGLMDAAMIEAVDAGKRELSAGYTCEIEFVDGVTPEGEKYNAIQRNIRINHVAVVDRGRAGSHCRIGDANPKQPKGKKMDLKTITFDGLSIDTTPQGAQVITALQGRVADSAKALEDANAAHATAIADKDKELAGKDAEIAKLKDAAVTPDKIDALVADRAGVIAKAAKLGDIDTAGKTNDEIRRAAVAAKMGDAALEGKSDDYVEAMFDHLSADADPVKDKLSQHKIGDRKSQHRGKDERVEAYDGYLASLNPTNEGDK